MSLSSLQLDAFATLARSRSFTEAASRLHVTQSALSQRISNLEEELQATLFVREPGGVRLTEVGQRLLRVCQAREALEGEFLGELKSKDSEALTGVARIAGYSTVVRSLLLPCLGEFGRRNPLVQFEVLTREVRELRGLLKSGQADFILCTHPIEMQAYENRLLGYETNVLIETKAAKQGPADVYIDHDEFDTTTAEFWKLQRAAPKRYRRAYFDEIYTIIDAVEEGFGRAVVPLHFIERNSRISIVPGLKPLLVPMYLIYLRQPFPTRLHSGLIACLSGIGEKRRSRCKPASIARASGVRTRR